MKLFSILMWLSFTLTKVNVIGISKTEEYLSLITKMYKFYKSSSIVFTYAGGHTDTSQRKKIQNIAMNFSKKSVMTLMITFEEFYKLKAYYRDKKSEMSEVRDPMIVAFLTTEKSLEKYSNMLKLVNKVPPGHKFHPYRSLVFFLKTNCYLKEEKPLLNFCMNPVGNPLHLRFDSQLLVKCYDENNIQEWYSVTGNETNVYELGTMDNKNEFVLKTNHTIYERRGGLRGKQLRTATYKNTKFIVREGNKLSGHTGKILELLREFLNFTLDLVSEEEILLGTWNDSSRRWSGMLNLLYEGKIDLIATRTTISSEKVRHFDLTMPLIITENFLYIKKPVNGVTWTGYVKPFRTNVWIIFGLYVLVSPILLTLIKMKVQELYIRPNLISENYLNVWGIFCQQGLTESPTANTLRIAYFSIFTLSLITWSAYCASLTSLIQVPNPVLSFKTLRGFLADGSYKLIVPKNSIKYATFQKPPTNEILKGMQNLLLEKSKLPETYKGGFKMACQEKIALYANDVLRNDYNEIVTCNLLQIPTRMFESVVIILPKNSQYLEVFNYYIQKLKDSGLLDRLQSDSPKHFVNTRPKPRHVFKQVKFSDINMPLAIAICGVIMGVTIFCFEKIIFYCKTKVY